MRLSARPARLGLIGWYETRRKQSVINRVTVSERFPEAREGEIGVEGPCCLDPAKNAERNF